MINEVRDMKNKTLYSGALVVLLTVLLLSACDIWHGEHPEPPLPVLAYGYQPNDEPYPPNPPTGAESPNKIAIITAARYTAPGPYPGDDWGVRLAEIYGPENVLVHAWPARFHREGDAETLAMMEGIANDPDIRILLVNPVFGNTDGLVGMLRDRRDDIFIIYVDGGEASNADLALRFDTDGVAAAFPAKARELGAATLVYFYDSETWLEEDDSYEESDLHKTIRSLCGEIGLTFVGFDINGAVQCGSSYAQFLSENLPPLIERYGPDVVFFGLDNERLLSYLNDNDFIYLPLYMAWFEPCPVNVARGLAVSDGGIKETLAERGLAGRVASWPMSARLLFPLAAVEYGFRQMRGEIIGEGIDDAVLTQIMVDLIAEHTGLQKSITLTVQENDVRVLMEYLVY
jgi:hypothetical protein